jgi:hypothetical protein
MIYKNVELYNVSELVKDDNGSYNMLRMPFDVEMGMDERGRHTNRYSCGVEIRFNLIGECAKIKLRVPDGYGVSRAIVLFGSIYSGWQECTKVIYDRETEIVVKNPFDKESLKKITDENKLPYDSTLIRVMLENTNVQFIDVEGELCPPNKEQLPTKRYLAYGSSITHGSIGLEASNTYANRTSEILGAELINLGFAGSARLEKAVADYIANRNDWDFATLEMGINVLDIEPDEYEKRITYFIDTVAKANKNKKIFCIDLFYTHSDFVKNGRANMFREIMRKTVERLGYENTIYINGLNILNTPLGLSADLIHPNCVYIPKMAENLSEIIKRNMTGETK